MAPSFIQTRMVIGLVPFIIIPDSKYPILVLWEFLPEPLSFNDKMFC